MKKQKKKIKPKKNLPSKDILNGRDYLVELRNRLTWEEEYLNGKFKR
jgi:hypothetical protein